MFPILMSYCTSAVPRWLLTACLGWIGGIGQAGSAILPLVTGLLAQKFGIGSLQPLYVTLLTPNGGILTSPLSVVSMMSTLVILWAFVPRVRRVD